MYQLATWNVNSLTVRLPQVLDWLNAHNGEQSIDVLALQETKTTDDKFPRSAFEDAGYQVAFFGQKTYNGVALLSPKPLVEISRGLKGFDDPQARVITAMFDKTVIVNVYVPNGQAVGSDKYHYKLAFLFHYYFNHISLSIIFFFIIHQHLFSLKVSYLFLKNSLS